MDKLHWSTLYEIFKYLNFGEMNNLRVCNSKLLEKGKDAMIILAEREANRILLSSDNTTRNLFVQKEMPKMLASNVDWYEFLIDQLNKRWELKLKLFDLIPRIYPKSNTEIQVKLTNFMFDEIKRKRFMDISLKKTVKQKVFLTSFQELVFDYYCGVSPSNYTRVILSKKELIGLKSMKDDFAEEIIKNDEVYLLKAFRKYENKQSEDTPYPKSSFLQYLYCIDKFLQYH